MGTKPILFNTENVVALLEGRKTVTRRVVKFPRGWNPKFTGYIPDGTALYGSNNIPAAKAPYQPGDILWVRETWRPFEVGCPPAHSIIEYKAGGTEKFDEIIALPTVEGKWRPSIHMPRKAARIFLRVTDVRAERLRDMVLADVLMEGIKETDEYEKTWDLWHQTWNHTIKPADLPAYGWEANPWVWVIGFERISKCGEAADAE